MSTSSDESEQNFRYQKSVFMRQNKQPVEHASIMNVLVVSQVVTFGYNLSLFLQSFYESK